MSTSKLYVRQMSSLDNGIAVYDPHPGYSGNEPNPRVQPGDVGYFTREGSFLRIFNIHSNEPGDESIPSDLTLYDLNPKYCRGSPFSARTISSSKRLSVFGKGKAVTPLPVGAGFSLDYERNQESVLHYFEPGWRENSIMRGNYERYIISDGDSWLRTARQYDPLLRAENIVLVTGCDLVRTWVIKVVDKKRIEGDVSLHVDVGLESGVEASYGVSWEESHGAIIHAGPAEIFNRSVLEDAAASSPHASKSKRRIRRVGNNISPTRTESAPPSKAASAEKIKEWSDQCIFIRGYRLKKRLRSGIAPIELKAAAGPADLPPRDNGSGEGAGLLRADDVDANLDNSEDRMADADHMHQVLDYILDNSDADLAIAHEEDLTSWARHAGVVVDSDNGWYLTAEYVLQNHPPPVNTKTYGGITVGVILADGGEMMRTGLEQASAVSGKLSIRHPRSSRNSLRRMGEKITRPVSSYLKAVKMTLGRSLKGPYVPPPSSDTSLLFLNQGSGSVELIGHTHYVNSVAFSPDGRCVVSGSDDHTIRVWDTVTGKAALPPLIGHTDGVRSIAFSSDGRRIISGSLDRTIRIWDTVTGKETLSPLQGHTGWVTSISVSPDGARIASGGFDCTIRIWDAVTGMETLSPLQGHTSWVTSVSFSPDSTRIVSGSFDRTVRIWDAATGDIVAGPVEGHQDTVTSAAFSPDGTKVVSGSHDGTICVWDALLSTVSRPINAFRGEAPTSVAYSPDGAYIISSIDDGTIRRWDAHTSELLSILSPTKTRTSPVLSISISPDGAYIASGSDDHAVRIWRTGDPSGIEAADKAESIQTSKRADTSISADPSSSKPDSSSASKSPFQIQESLNAVLDAQSTSESGGQWLGDRKRPESFTQANQEPQQSPTPV